MAVSRLRVRVASLAAALLLLARGGRAQGSPGPPVMPSDSLHQQLTINIVLPKSVGVVRDCVRILFSRQDAQEKAKALLARRRQKTERPVVGVGLRVPKNRLTKTLRLVD